jgi:hypothetical protein
MMTTTMMMTTMMNRAFTLALIVLTTFTHCDKIDPKIDFAVHRDFIDKLTCPFLALSQEEKPLAFANEFVIAQKFAQELDLYQSVQCFRRARFLLEPHQAQRLVQIDYSILLSYYFAKRYDDVITTYEESSLTSLNFKFLPYQDLLCILYDSYNKEKKQLQADHILNILSNIDPQKAEALNLSNAFETANFKKMKSLCKKDRIYTTLERLYSTFKDEISDAQKQDMFLCIQNPESMPMYAVEHSLNKEQKSALKELTDFNHLHKESHNIMRTYQKSAKSPFKAAALNAFVPGLGYLYLGQKQSAFTAFCLNSLFIASAVHFYQVGNLPAAVVTLSFESGWYAGGILGAKENAKLYNERLYESLYSNHMKKNNLFATTMLSYGF